jgi:hypothetical protein
MINEELPYANKYFILLQSINLKHFKTKGNIMAKFIFTPKYVKIEGLYI